MLLIWVEQGGVVRVLALVFRVLTGGPSRQCGVTGDSSRVVIYAAIAGVTL